TMIAVLCAGHCCSFVITRNEPLSALRVRSVSVSPFSSLMPGAGTRRRTAAAVGSKEGRMEHLVVGPMVQRIESDGHKHTREWRGSQRHKVQTQIPRWRPLHWRLKPAGS